MRKILFLGRKLFSGFAKGAALILLALAVLFVPASVTAQQTTGETGGDNADDIIRRTSLSFVTSDDYPPFQYRNEEGELTGFNVDLAQAICLELEMSCDVQVRPWNEVLEVLNAGQVDAAIASVATTPDTLARADFTSPYYFTPARFAARRDAGDHQITPKGLEGQRVGVVEGTAHQAYLKAFFRDSIIDTFETRDAARKALVEGEIELLFDDGISLVFWLNGTLSKGCCEFRGGAFAEPRYFGEGVSIAVANGRNDLRNLLNKALQRVRISGRFEELFLRYFPYPAY